MSLIAVYEGDTDLPVLRKLVQDAGLSITSEIDCAGKSRLDEALAGYNAAAQGFPWLVLRDLDDDAPCAGDFLRARDFVPAPWMCLRIAVRELEAWLLADARGLADFLKIRPEWIPEDPDAEADPTVTLVNLARRSRSVAVRRALVPAIGRSTVVGPLYESKIIEFGQRHWDLDRACQRSRSLQRARTAIRKLAERWNQHLQGYSS